MSTDTDEYEPKPGLIILDMSNDDLDSVTYNKDTVIENCRTLAMSDFFHVCIESKQQAPKLKALSKGPKLIDPLNKLNHLKHIQKRTESALQGTQVFKSLKDKGITHVCVCGTSTDSSVFATVKDLIEHDFDVFVVKDAISSKNGKEGHEKGIIEISSRFGADLVVGIDDLLGDEEDLKERVVDGVENVDVAVSGKDQKTNTKAAPSLSANTNQKGPRKPLNEMTEAEKAEEMRRRDAEKLAARKKQFDAARFAHIETANAKAQEQAIVFEKRLEEKKIPGAKYHPRTLPNSSTDPANEAPKTMRKGWKLMYKKKEDPVLKVEPSKPLPPLAGKNERPTNVRQEVNPGWASVEKQKERPQTQKHSSELDCHGLANSAPTPVNPAVPYITVPEGPKYKEVDYGTQTTKPQMEGVNISGSITNLQGGGPRTKMGGPRSMVKAKVSESKTESFDAHGNVIKTITRHITEPDGKKRTETEVIKIPKQ